ncbi:VWA domain-containing protein [Roseovarius sp. D0-M9]|uniref:VWA domain-containing protein n=1 Tax=Roseovarius sp. D0-M9 TaxID=3127117 RepID=UPI0030102354
MKKTVVQTIAMALAGGLACAVPGTATADETADENVMIVFDGSNSMWGQIDGTAKIEIARGVMENLLGDWTDSRQVGLMAYGHRNRGDCSDIETLVTPGPDTRGRILERIGAITPTGKTPLTSAVEEAATSLSYTDTPATVILISDGLESCERDLCALAETLEARGIGFTAHVVGFGLGDADASALSCIAERTGGRYISADNADELGDALTAVGSAVVQSEPEPEPEPEPEQQYDVTVTAPDTALAGSAFDVSWTGTVSGRDFVTIVPVGTDEGDHGNYVRVGDKSEDALRAPAETGLYEVRYVLDEGRRTLASQPIEVTEPEVTVTAPDTALAGSAFDVSWTGTVSGRDFVTIVPVGTDEGDHGNYVRVGDKSEDALRAPAETGLYEVRYVLDEGRRTLASQPIEVTEPEVTVTAPDTALAGSAFDVSWTGTVSGRDFVTIVPVGTDEGDHGNYVRVGDKSEDALRAPAETGLYEVRYVLDEGRRTLASQPIEVTEPEVTVTAPDTALAGSAFDVSWTGTVSGRDFVTIVPVGTDEGDHGNYVRVGDKSEDALRAPAETGLYEVRYVLDEGRRTLASRPIEVIEPEVTVTAPDTALAGSVFDVSWTGTVSGRDFVTIVPVGTDEGDHGNYVRVGDKSEDALRAPAETGLYEVRYVLDEGRRTLASQPIEVTEPEVTVTAPDKIRAGDAIKVSWTGAVAGRDFVTIVPMGTEEGQHEGYFRVQESTEDELRAPDDAGLYEIRYVLDEGRRTLARHAIEVLAEDAALQNGAAIEAPENASAGATIDVSWTTARESGDQRITLAKANQAIFTWITAVRIEGDAPIAMTLPDAPGSYELRFLDVANQEVLARHVIEVK